MPIVTTTATESGGVGGYTKTTTTTAASHEPAAAAAAPPPPGFLPGYTAELDQIFEELLNHPSAPLPGFVAKVKRGADIYHKAFGYADVAANRKMELDAQMRVFSMTKVLASTVGLMLVDKGLMRLNDPVSKFLPSFDREWAVVTVVPDGDAGGDVESVDYTSFLSGETSNLKYTQKPSTSVMTIKHLMSESSGISYDMWQDFGMMPEAGVVQVLRRTAGKGQYSSNAIIGQDVTLEEYVDAIAAAGVLTVEPGMFSYGLGNLVLGRVIEVIVASTHGVHKPFSTIMSEMLFEPLGMSTAAFFLSDNDPRIAKFPELYGSTPDGGEGEKFVPYSTLHATKEGSMVPPNTVTTDSYAGPRKCESGDTGTCMTVDDYSKFYDFLHAGGVAPNGKRLLQKSTVEVLTKKRIRGIECSNNLATAFGVNGDAAPIPQSFMLGWAIKHLDGDIDDINPQMQSCECEWSGYANNRGTFYPDEEAYVLVFPQVMVPSPGGFNISGTIAEARAKITALWN